MNGAAPARTSRSPIRSVSPLDGPPRLPDADQAEGPVAAAVDHGDDDVRRRRPLARLVFLTCLGGALSAGGAGAINHAVDRDIDRTMARTADRPVASGRVSPAAAIAFGTLLGCASFVLLALTVNPLAAALSLSGLLGYVFVYTLWLKRTTPQNIVIGGAAGAVPPLVAWAAVTGGLSGMAFYLFAIVFFWTPPHFWALSLLMKDEYAKAGIPMLPVVRGEDETRRQILLYTVLLYAVTQLPFCAGGLRGRLPGRPRWRWAPASSTAPCGCCARATAAGRCGPTSSRSPTWRCSSSRCPSTPNV